jgi:hypothetical protein
MGPTNNTLTNDTFFNNVVGIELVDVSGSGTITSSTFAFNTSGGPLFVSETAGNISIGSDIIDGGFQNYCGANIDLGYNAWYNFPGSECNLSSANHDALGPLGLAFGVSNNGGPVPTDPISAGSAAINLVPIGSLCPATDARGYFRPGVGESNCTAGAYEYNAAPPWYVRQFSAGWNLVSVPLQGAATSASSLSSSLNAAAGDTVVSVVSTYANGRFSLYVPGYSADLSLQPAQGVFVRSSAAFTSQPSGALYNTGQAVTLLPGWNLVAAPYPSAGLMTNTVASEASACNVQEVATYSAGSYSTWTPAMGAAAAFLVPATSGMWIECATAASWTPS